MLVLSRKIGQTIVIGEGIEITVVEMRGDQVRLGIHAPREVPVNRKEILSRSAGAPSAPGARRPADHAETSPERAAPAQPGVESLSPAPSIPVAAPLAGVPTPAAGADPALVPDPPAGDVLASVAERLPLTPNHSAAPRLV